MISVRLAICSRCLQTMLENAVRICDAKFGNIYRWDGEPFISLQRTTRRLLRRSTLGIRRFVPVRKTPRSHGSDQSSRSTSPTGLAEQATLTTYPAAVQLSNLAAYGRFSLFRC